RLHHGRWGNDRWRWRFDLGRRLLFGLAYAFFELLQLLRRSLSFGLGRRLELPSLFVLVPLPQHLVLLLDLTLEIVVLPHLLSLEHQERRVRGHDLILHAEIRHFGLLRRALRHQVGDLSLRPETAHVVIALFLCREGDVDLATIAAAR